MKNIALLVFLITVAKVATGLKLFNTQSNSVKNADDTIIRKLIPGQSFFKTPMPRPAGIKPRITGGAYAWNNQLPYQVSLTVTFTNNEIGYCGGTLIGNEWVLSAAHCFAKDFNSVKIGMGGIDRNNPLHKTWASMLLMPTKWDPSTLNDDVALLKFPWVNFNAWIAPAYLPSKNSQHTTFVDNRVTTSGWGFVNDEGETTNFLKYVTMTVVDNGVCARTFGFDKQSIAGVMCVSTPQGYSTCSGDSGGPLVIENSRLLVGVSSFVSAKGCTKGLPIGFTRVSKYLDWIEKNTGISGIPDFN